MAQKKFLDEMTIDGEIAGDFLLTIRFGRDHGESAARGEFAANPVIVEAFIADQRVDCDAVEQRLDADSVVALAGQENETRQIAQRVD